MIFNKIISKISKLLGKTRGRIQGTMGKIHQTVAVGASSGLFAHSTRQQHMASCARLVPAARLLLPEISSVFHGLFSSPRPRVTHVAGCRSMGLDKWS
jgi:hypothetical protein